MTDSTRAGHRALSNGRYKDAVRSFRRALDRLERKHGPNALALVAPLNDLAISYQQLGRFVDAGLLYQRALALLERHGRLQTVAAADILQNMGSLEHAAGNGLRGEPYARRALRLRRRIAGRDHPTVAAGLVGLAALVDRQGRFREAERLYSRALRILTSSSGWADLVAIATTNLGALKHAQGKFDEAEEMYRRALALDAPPGGAAHPRAAFSMNNLAQLLAETGRTRQAAALFRRAVRIFSNAHGPNHLNVGICLENYARVLRRLGRAAPARAAALRAKTILSNVDAVNDEAVAVTGTVNLQFTRYRVSARRSAIHRLGVFADEAIPRGRKVIEYTGERISRRESGRRWDPGRSYLFEINEKVHLDGAIGGSGAEYINHSCDPNLKTRILRDHILYFSKRDIAAGEELTVDYKYDADTDRMPCSCGAPTCRGTMNVLPPKPATSSQA